jgi:hypothetical protein
MGGHIRRPMILKQFQNVDYRLYSRTYLIMILCVSGLERLYNFRREHMVRKLFNDIQNPAQNLNNVLPFKRCFSSVSTRNYDYRYELPVAKTM